MLSLTLKLARCTAKAVGAIRLLCDGASQQPSFALRTAATMLAMDPAGIGSSCCHACVQAARASERLTSAVEQGQTLAASLITFVLVDVLSPRQACVGSCPCPAREQVMPRQ